jgi:hypothetical protein
MAEHSQKMRPLRRLHEDRMLKQRTLEHFRAQHTEDILRSLLAQGPEKLKIRSDGLVLQGNHRIKVLEERGYDTSQLYEQAEVIPREALGC